MRTPSQPYTSHWITVPRVCIDMQIEPYISITVPVGVVMQNRFFKRMGHQPPKENAPKTHGGGVHCFAHYPPDWREEIEKEIKKHRIEAAKQRDLFKSEEIDPDDDQPE